MGIQRYLGANTLYGKKRSRLAGPHEPQKPEIKEFNMLHPTDRVGYTAVDILPWVASHVENFPSNSYGAWQFLPLLFPNQGTGDSERIGKQIYLRGIQIRGYIEIRDAMVFPCNWRLVLYRQKRVVNEGTIVASEVYKNWENMDLELNNEFATLAHYRHNFYKAMYNQEFNDVGSRQVLAKGRVVPCIDDPKGGRISRSWNLSVGGSSISYNVQQREIFDVTCAYYPIKKIVRCNIDMDPDEDFLYLMLETDMPYSGSKNNANSVPNVPDAGVIEPSLAANDIPFKFNIFVRGYFTDS